MSLKKRARALKFLNLLPHHTVSEIAKILNKPVSTIQKHDNALKRLLGLLGQDLRQDAFTALALWDSGREQIKSTNSSTDHKMVSDLVAMRWAMDVKTKELEQEELFNTQLGLIAQEVASQIKLDVNKIEALVRSDFKTPIDDVSQALDDLINSLGDLSPDGIDALDNLTECVIALEELTTRL